MDKTISNGEILEVISETGEIIRYEYLGVVKLKNIGLKFQPYHHIINIGNKEGNSMLVLEEWFKKKDLRVIK